MADRDLCGRRGPARLYRGHGQRRGYARRASPSGAGTMSRATATAPTVAMSGMASGSARSIMSSQAGRCRPGGPGGAEPVAGAWAPATAQPAAGGRPLPSRPPSAAAPCAASPVSQRVQANRAPATWATARDSRRAAAPATAIQPRRPGRIAWPPACSAAYRLRPCKIDGCRVPRQIADSAWRASV